MVITKVITADYLDVRFGRVDHSGIVRFTWQARVRHIRSKSERDHDPTSSGHKSVLPRNTAQRDHFFFKD